MENVTETLVQIVSEFNHFKTFSSCAKDERLTTNDQFNFFAMPCSPEWNNIHGQFDYLIYTFFCLSHMGRK